MHTILVHVRGKPGVRLAQNIAIPQGKTGEIGSTKTLDLPVCLLFPPLFTEKQKQDDHHPDLWNRQSGFSVSIVETPARKQVG